MDELESVHRALQHALHHAEEAGDDYKRSAKALNELVAPLSLAAIALELRAIRSGSQATPGAVRPDGKPAVAAARFDQPSESARAA